MADNEHTSLSVAPWAAKVLAMTDRELIHFAVDHPDILRRIAASDLTQAPDRADG